MNIILFEPDETEKPLSKEDVRAKHILEVLRRKVGDDFDAGIIDGERGKARLVEIAEDSLVLGFELNIEEPELFPIDLIVGLSRPQTNRKILQEATSLGVRSMSFVTTERGEPSYSSSKLWTTQEWRRHVVAGAVQAFTTRIPEVRFGCGLEETIEAFAGKAVRRIALDNYESERSLGLGSSGGGVLLAIGSERGWTGAERDLLRASEFELMDLGERPLRTETAVIAAVSLVKAML